VKDLCAEFGIPTAAYRHFSEPKAAKTFADTLGLPVVIKADGAKMAPVTFSHAVHVEKVKVECVKCHHKEPDNPKACKTCHDLKEVKNGAPKIQDAFHKLCQTCHKEQAEKGAKAPTKCNECHKK